MYKSTVLKNPEFQVDVLLSRDLDSRLSFREVAAVNEWMTTESKAIHAMRDNPAHRIGLLGASWGTDLTKDNARGRWKKTWEVSLLSEPSVTLLLLLFKFSHFFHHVLFY